MISERLKELRIKNKKTQQDLADLLGISRQGYSKYEKGKSVPDANMLNTLADHYEVSADYILCRSQKKEFENNIDIKKFLEDIEQSNHSKQKKLLSIWEIIK